MAEPEEARFTRFVSPEPNTGCWLWTGNVSSDGYGHFWNRGRDEKATRYAYRTMVGRIPDGLWVLHRCDNPSCVNPAHLFVGTPRDNVLDMFAKGRGNPPRGERHHQAKLTAEDVEAIRSTGGPAWRLAEKYGVCASHIRRVRRGRVWRLP